MFQSSPSIYACFPIRQCYLWTPTQVHCFPSMAAESHWSEAFLSPSLASRTLWSTMPSAWVGRFSQPAAGPSHVTQCRNSSVNERFARNLLTILGGLWSFIWDQYLFLMLLVPRFASTAHRTASRSDGLTSFARWVVRALDSICWSVHGACFQSPSASSSSLTTAKRKGQPSNPLVSAWSLAFVASTFHCW